VYHVSSYSQRVVIYFSVPVWIQRSRYVHCVLKGVDLTCSSGTYTTKETVYVRSLDIRRLSRMSTSTMPEPSSYLHHTIDISNSGIPRLENVFRFSLMVKSRMSSSIIPMEISRISSWLVCRIRRLSRYVKPNCVRSGADV
jgi:hypothetical protein